MEQNFNSKKNTSNIVDTHNSNLFSKIVFITNNYNNEFNIQKDHDKICKYCKKKYYSKFNKERHENSC